MSEASGFAAITDNARTSAGATCAKKRHVVAGGFLASPAVFPGPALLIGIDENLPVGKRGWEVGLWEYPTALPPGSSLQTFAYCKKG